MNIIKKNNLYYLKHSFKKNNKTITKEKYLGKEIPENFESIKKQLLLECRKEAFYENFDKIKNNFKNNWNKTPNSVKKDMIKEFSINFTYNTNKIEGSTITEEETRNIINQTISPNKSLIDITETNNHSKLFLEVLDHEQKINTETILDWHNKLFSDTKPEISGKLRDYLVFVSNYKAPDWQDVPNLLNDLFNFIDENNNMNVIELVARTHYKFEKIHPFGDGNGRLGRLLINSMLWHKGYPILVIDYKNRKSYYNALKNDEEKFVQYFIRRYLSSHKNYLN
jgi:Fic family protein